jgi:signal recognition particle subunit SRP54
MFEGLSARLSAALGSLGKRGLLSEKDVAAALREIRHALLEADVALEVVRSFTESVRQRAVGIEVVKSVQPAQMVVKIVHDELVALLGSDADPLDLNSAPPVTFLMVGLQGSGKTTTTAKMARRLKERLKKKVLLASLDTRRPAAMEQLAILGEQVGVETLPIVAGQDALTIALRAQDAAKRGGFDVLILDTAGRVTLDDDLMEEVIQVKAKTAPHEVLLVADALTGQDAVVTARAFNERIGLTGLVLTRMDGDSRGGAALSMRAITGKPIKLIGTGEKVDALDDFSPQRVADRILGMGDIVALVERAAETIDQERAEHMAKKMARGAMDLEDMRFQLQQMSSMGGIGALMGMLPTGLMPGLGDVQKQRIDSEFSATALKRMIAIIDSMTPQERRKPEILKASRKRRIAAGSGTSLETINKLLKMHDQMATMMRKMAKDKGQFGRLKQMFGFGKPGKEVPQGQDLQELMNSLPPGAFPGGGMPGMGGMLPKALGGRLFGGGAPSFLKKR